VAVTCRRLTCRRLLSADHVSKHTHTHTHTQVWITDSCPMQAELVNGKGPFEVLSLAPLIASQIDTELERGGSLGSSSARQLSRL
jgi:hypothetical protein